MARNNETPIRVGLLGAGTVGSQTARLIVEQKDELSARIGRPIELTGVACLDPKETEKFPWIDQSIVTTDTLSVATNSDIVIELIGGTTVARKFVLAAIAAEFAKNGVSINGVNQDLKPTMTDPGYDGEIQQLRVVTHLTDEETLRNTVKAVQALDFVTGDPSILRVLD